MGAFCSRRSKEAALVTEANVVVSGGGGRTVQLQVGSRYKTGGEVKARAAILFKVPDAEAVLMCGSDKVSDEEELMTTRQSALTGKPPHLHLLRVRKQMAITGTYAGSMTVYDMENREVAKHLPSEHLHGIWCLDAHWESQRCVSGSEDKTLKLWDLDRNRASSFRGHTSGVTCVSVDWEHEVMLSGSMDNSLKMWNIKDCKLIKTITVHEDAVQCLCADWTTESAVTGSCDKTIKLVDLKSEECTITLEGHDSIIMCLQADWASRRVISGARGSATKAPKGYERTNGGNSALTGQNLKLWDLSSGECLKTFQGHEADILCVAVDWSSQRALTAGADRALKMWDMASGECVRTFAGHNDFVASVQVDWMARRAFSGCGNSELKIWDLDSGDCLHSWKLEERDCVMGRGQVRALALEPFPSDRG